MTYAARGPSARDATPDEPDPFEHPPLARIGAITDGLGHTLRNAVMPALLQLDTLAATDHLPPAARQELQRVRAILVPLQQLIAGLHVRATAGHGPERAAPTTDVAHGWRALEPLVVTVSDGVEAMVQRSAMPGEDFSVLCIDDNELLVDALEGRLALEPGFRTLHRALPLTAASTIAERERPELILLDYDLPHGIDAIELLDTLHRDAPESRVIMFTGYANGQLIAHAMRHGASGFVSKGASVEHLLDAMRRVRDGETVIEPDAA